MLPKEKDQIYKLFKPQLSPKKMLELGVFGGSYFNKSQIKEFPKSWFKNAKLSEKFDVSLNRFKVKSGLTRKEWIDKGWIFKEDPLGWFQWYCRYSNGRRIQNIDQIQMQRWFNFTRHVKAIKKNCERNDLTCRRRQRQAILQWAYNPFI
ncbi:MAG: hypothetical protein CNC06_03550 [Pelagibacterales bacterium MED-G40]|nr:MAG: hypothetical protein CBD63_01810 [Candidatus Pelagibacter sp. TMED203]PDH19631.1 MAG: hypothetical protein CNC06_03550 [Pelagibacterales bacterium MED-G40]